jgi:hypothetical protein
MGTNNNVPSAQSRIGAAHCHDNVSGLCASSAKGLKVRRLAWRTRRASVAESTTQSELRVPVRKKYCCGIPPGTSGFAPAQLFACQVRDIRGHPRGGGRPAELRERCATTSRAAEQPNPKTPSAHPFPDGTQQVRFQITFRGWRRGASTSGGRSCSALRSPRKSSQLERHARRVSLEGAEGARKRQPHCYLTTHTSSVDSSTTRSCTYPLPPATGRPRLDARARCPSCPS